MRRPEIIDLSLDRVRGALELLDIEQDQLPPVIHVAGTNGKGSTSAFIRTIFEHAAYCVHQFISPHLVRFNERIVIAGNEVSDEEFLSALADIEKVTSEIALTHFETITCAAFQLFARNHADVLLLEVGLGGRLDATNAIHQTALSLITPIDFDHQQFLGNTISQIAAEKSGIFRNGTPAVIGRQSADALAVIRDAASAIGAPIYACGVEWDAYREHDRLIFKDEHELAEYPLPRMLGDHQIDNAGLAIAAVKMAAQRNMFTLSEKTIATGIQSTYWPGRLQRLTTGPLVDIITAARNPSLDIEFWVDGGHNPSAGRAVARAMSSLEHRSPRRLVLITGMQANKDAAGFLAPFAGLAAKVYCIEASSGTPAIAANIAEAARKAGLPAETSQSLNAAIAAARQDHPDEPLRVLICGSLYLVGEALTDNN